ncbi:surface lipoprotein assembly modifier [Stakelama marina]|uniref:DUF560 domain-containing protein n=1 Tax=Stakelama marina TaxID=2826939 RepID=A0A8T4IB28_9SPHN|nr:surface lipoprotein assembly modifier [Stakelama marina]MBR0551312.1 DUF560 domain-containing protein [Stakelama marina]
MRITAAIALLAATLAAVPTHAQTLLDRCAAATCKARLTPEQLLGETQVLIRDKRYDEAKVLLAALSKIPELRFETRYLTGMVAAATGDNQTAADEYKAILANDPSQTRVRLELAKTMLAMGKPQSADRQFRIAQQDDDLPPDVARTIRTVRNIIRSRRAWSLDVDFGIAPDTNINNATDASTVTVLFGSIPIPLTLDEKAKARSGTGETGSISAGLRLPVADRMAMLFDLDSIGTNYAGSDYDDYLVQFAAGPSYRITDRLSVSGQAVGAQRWFGGDVVTRQVGTKLGAQLTLSDSDQIGAQIDLRKTDAKFDPAYDGWQGSAYLSYERAVSKTLVASLGAFARRDWLAADAYSSKEYGGTLGIGGELPLGINFAVSGTVSRATYDAPMPLFSVEPRKDWRYGARASLGYRKIRVLGFSPSMSVSYATTDSSVRYYATDRTRFRFTLARYF